MTQFSYSKLPRECKIFASGYWLEALRVENNVQGNVALVRALLGTPDMPWEEALTKVRLFHRIDEGKPIGNGEWRNFVKRNYPHIEFTLHHPIWQLCSRTRFTGEMLQELRYAIPSLFTLVRCETHKLSGLTKIKPLIYPAHLSRITKYKSLDALTLLLIECREQFKQRSRLWVHLEYETVRLMNILMFNSPMRLFAEKLYNEFFHFVFPNPKTSGMADDLYNIRPFSIRTTGPPRMFVSPQNPKLKMYFKCFFGSKKKTNFPKRPVQMEHELFN